MNYGTTNIQLIIDGCLVNDQAAQKRLFDLRYGFVMAICQRFARHRQEAQEMLNDCFYTLFKFIDRYDSTYPFEPWLRKLCVNCCLMYQRKYFKTEQSYPLDEMHEELQYEEMQLPSLESYDYMKLLDKLPPACKTVLVLFVIEGYKHSEIAEKLGISTGTSKSNLSRAKKLLFEMVEKNSKGQLTLKRKIRE